jgi:hypothetical protein
VALCADLTPKELVSATESGACRSLERAAVEPFSPSSRKYQKDAPLSIKASQPYFIK